MIDNDAERQTRGGAAQYYRALLHENGVGAMLALLSEAEAEVWIGKAIQAVTKAVLADLPQCWGADEGKETSIAAAKSELRAFWQAAMAERAWCLAHLSARGRA
ncbi:MAG TPA: hypothetical protein VJ770_29475 [Stellaceae bacterium]|nr:hypothetical protein [Stellaceae bacterium]